MTIEETNRSALKGSVTTTYRVGNETLTLVSTFANEVPLDKILFDIIKSRSIQTAQYAV